MDIATIRLLALVLGLVLIIIAVLLFFVSLRQGPGKTIGVDEGQTSIITVSKRNGRLNIDISTMMADDRATQEGYYYQARSEEPAELFYDYSVGYNSRKYKRVLDGLSDISTDEDRKYAYQTLVQDYNALPEDARRLVYGDDKEPDPAKDPGDDDGDDSFQPPIGDDDASGKPEKEPGNGVGEGHVVADPEDGKASETVGKTEGGHSGEAGDEGGERKQEVNKDDSCDAPLPNDEDFGEGAGLNVAKEEPEEEGEKEPSDSDVTPPQAEGNTETDPLQPPVQEPEKGTQGQAASHPAPLIVQDIILEFDDFEDLYY